jgi:hypothetical protein
MKRFIIKIGSLILAVYVLQYLLFIIGKNVLDNYSNFRFTRYFRDKNHKYYVLGNSRAVNSINEQYINDSLKLDVINMSYSGMPYNVVKSFLYDISENQHNKIILIELSSLFNNNIDMNYVYYLSNSIYFKNNYKNTLYNYLPLSRFNNELFLRNLYYLIKNDKNWNNKYTINNNLIKSIQNDSLQNIFIDKEILTNRINELISISKDNKIIFFLAPYYPEYLKKINNYEKYNATIFKDYEIYDLNILKLEKESFADRIHMNENGSIQLSKYLFNEIVNTEND